MATNLTIAAARRFLDSHVGESFTTEQTTTNMDGTVGTWSPGVRTLGKSGVSQYLFNGSLLTPAGMTVLDLTERAVTFHNAHIGLGQTVTYALV